MNRTTLLGGSLLILGLVLIALAAAVLVSALDSEPSASVAQPSSPTPSVVPGALPESGAGVGGFAASFVDPEHGWITIGGSILATEDGGVHWHEQLQGPDTGISIQFISPTTGWLVSGVGLFLTKDGGATWTLVDTQIPSRQDSLYSFAEFQDDLHAFVNVSVDLKPQLMGTSDGGVSFRELRMPCADPMDLFYRPVDFIDQNVGWAVCSPFFKPAGQSVDLMKTSDGGQTWEFVSDLRSSVSGTDIASSASLHFVDDNVGWFGSSGSGLYRTTDGGRSWQQMATGAGTITMVQPFSDQLIYIAVEGGGVFKTADAGQTWTTIYPPAAPTAERPCTAADLTAELHGYNGAMQSHIGGVVVTNVAAAACWVEGRPTVTTITPSGERLGPRGPAPSVDTGRVDLAPGQRAGVGLSWPTSCDVEFSSAASLRLEFPDGGVVATDVTQNVNHRGTAYCTDPPSGPGVGIFEAVSPPISSP